ncbi:hypothetical protein M2137_002720 [Parabacteroides sp. PFB2-10]|nr:hypothetical protein [Parabacteroides sp. PFB2-10]
MNGSFCEEGAVSFYIYKAKYVTCRKTFVT